MLGEGISPLDRRVRSLPFPALWIDFDRCEKSPVMRQPFSWRHPTLRSPMAGCSIGPSRGRGAHRGVGAMAVVEMPGRVGHGAPSGRASFWLTDGYVSSSTVAARGF